MSRTIALLLSRTDPASQGSVAYVNKITETLLAEAGWSTRPFLVAPPALARESIIPLALASAQAAELGITPVDFALHDDAGILARAPSRRWARRNVVLYHGLAYGAGMWLGNPEIDLHCANSPYLARVIRSMLAFPNWSERRCLDPRAFDIVTDLALPLPCLAEDAGQEAFSHGADLPASVTCLLDDGVILGHAIQPRKQDMLATASILYWLNQTARAEQSPPIKLVLSAASLDAARRQRIDAILAPTGYCCDDFFVLVPQLRQSAVFQIMQASRFCLAYNRFPEPFGFYVLESVFHGCPVYTNGIGNNRFLLPPDHGIVVDETAEMVGEITDAHAYRHVAARIHRDLSNAADGHLACARGARIIRDRWSRAAFGHSLEAALARADATDGREHDFDALVVSISPLLRSLDRASGRCLNDYANTVLSPDAIDTANELLGRACADLDANKMHRLEAHHGLFRRGILALAPPDQAVTAW